MRRAATRLTRLLPTILWFVVGAVLVVQVFLLLHELGHALAAVSVGGAVIGFDARLLSPRPHVSYAFLDVTAGQRAFVSAAGTLLPTLVWGTVILALPRRVAPHVALLRLGASAGVLAGLLPWLVFPWPAFQMGVASSRPHLDVAEGPWTVRLWAHETVGRFRLWIDEESVTLEGP